MSFTLQDIRNSLDNPRQNPFKPGTTFFNLFQYTEFERHSEPYEEDPHNSAFFQGLLDQRTEEVRRLTSKLERAQKVATSLLDVLLVYVERDKS